MLIRIAGLAVIAALTPHAVTAQAGGAEIRPFEIAVPDEVLDDLRRRLERTRLPDQLDGAGWDYGAELDYVTELIAYWRDDFDWREQERRLNAFDQYKTVIGDLDIHFIHQRSPEPTPCRSSSPTAGPVDRRVHEDHRSPDGPGGPRRRAEDAFHVVAPSMPGYGFSDKPRAPGFGPEQIAEVGAELMARLGYGRYGIQGGDWGSIVSRWHAFNHPDRAVGLHLNMLVGGPPPGADPTEGVPPEELRRSRSRQSFYNTAENGYAQIQGTKPQTLGYALNDSPAGQAAWIVEKFRAWCDCNGDPESVFTRGRTAHQHHHLLGDGHRDLLGPALLREPSRADVAAPGARRGADRRHHLPLRAVHHPRRWAEASYNITHWTEVERGGHFAAMEQPEVLVNDLREFFRPLR